MYAINTNKLTAENEHLNLLLTKHLYKKLFLKNEKLWEKKIQNLTLPYLQTTRSSARFRLRIVFANQTATTDQIKSLKQKSDISERESICRSTNG